MSLITQINTLLSYIPEVALPKKKQSVATSTGAPLRSSCPEAMNKIVRIAGLSGAIAVAVGAYGAHVIRDDESIDVRRKKAFETGSRYHLIHTLALLAAPRARYPLVTSTVFLSGIVMFCGPCYHYSLTGKENTRRFTPIGGVLFILGWLTFML
uniref:Transmembrane protein 256 homolog n=1 Tax=Haemonchus contortus TaxID=6289 RepID=A0A7I4XZR0_HAECO